MKLKRKKKLKKVKVVYSYVDRIYYNIDEKGNIIKHNKN